MLCQLSYAVFAYTPCDSSHIAKISPMNNFRYFHCIRIDQSQTTIWVGLSQSFNLVPRACDPREGTWGFGSGSQESWLRLNCAFHINDQSDSSLKRIIPEPHVPSRGSPRYTPSSFPWLLGCLREALGTRMAMHWTATLAFSWNC